MVCLNSLSVDKIKKLKYCYVAGIWGHSTYIIYKRLEDDKNYPLEYLLKQLDYAFTNKKEAVFKRREMIKYKEHNNVR